MPRQPGEGPPSLTARLLTLPQFLIPQHLLTRIVRGLTHCTWKPLKSLLILRFIQLYRVDMRSAAEPDPAAYPSFNAFFTRALRADARPLAPDPRSLACPIDGAVSQAGTIQRDTLLQAKGKRYSLLELLAGDTRLAGLFEDGLYATLYLSPRDYHRIHMPLEGRLRNVTYVPGRLFAVNARTVRVVPGVFARNERAICIFDTVAGPMALVTVAALFVSGMETVWEGPMLPAADGQPHRRDYPESGEGAVRIGRGAEMGRFNMGSTVILLFGNGRVAWSASLRSEAVLCMGEPIGEVLP